MSLMNKFSLEEMIKMSKGYVMMAMGKDYPNKHIFVFTPIKQTQKLIQLV